MTIVGALDRNHRSQHCAGAIHDRHNPTNALHAAKALDRQAQSNRRLRTKTSVSKTTQNERSTLS